MKKALILIVIFFCSTITYAEPRLKWHDGNSSVSLLISSEKELSVEIKNQAQGFTLRIEGYYNQETIFSYEQLKILLRNMDDDLETFKKYFVDLYGFDEDRVDLSNSESEPALIINNFTASEFVKAIFAMRNSNYIKDVFFHVQKIEEKETNSNPEENSEPP